MDSFSCAECGRHFRWQARSAGKTARCACGVFVRIPMRPEMTDDVELATVVETPAAPPPGGAIAYQAAAPSDEDTRVEAAEAALYDLYFPAGLLAAAVLSLMVWLLTRRTWGTREFYIMMELTLGVIVVKALVLSGLAWIIAASSGGSFGRPGTTLLKIGAMIVSLDAILLWTRALMRGAGLITTLNHSSSGAWAVQMLVLLFAALAIARFLYRMDDNAATTLGCVVAAGNVAINIAFIVLLIIVLNFLIGVQKQVLAAAAARKSAPAAAASASTQPSNATGSAPAVAPLATLGDRSIAARLRHDSAFIATGRQWQLNHKYDQKNLPARLLIDSLYNAGASEIFVDSHLGRASSAGAMQGSTEVYVDLPVDPAKRAACINAAQQYLTQNGGSSAPNLAVPGRYLRVPLLH